jgi:ABC-type lipoprotein release transport system permease subunit
VYASVALLILVVSLLASALPTFRATRANPLDALRLGQ